LCLYNTSGFRATTLHHCLWCLANSACCVTWVKKPFNLLSNSSNNLISSWRTKTWCFHDIVSTHPNWSRDEQLVSWTTVSNAFIQVNWEHLVALNIPSQWNWRARRYRWVVS
jgi:hypothetical protein